MSFNRRRQIQQHNLQFAQDDRETMASSEPPSIEERFLQLQEEHRQLQLEHANMKTSLVADISCQMKRICQITRCHKEDIKRHEEDRKRHEEDKKRYEEDRQRYEEDINHHKKCHEEDKKHHEEDRKRLEEFRKRYEEDIKHHEEDRKRLEEFRKRYEEDIKRHEERHKEDRIRYEEEKKYHEEDIKRLEEFRKRHEEDIKRHEERHEEDRIRHEEDIKRFASQSQFSFGKKLIPPKYEEVRKEQEASERSSKSALLSANAETMALLKRAEEASEKYEILVNGLREDQMKMKTISEQLISSVQNSLSEQEEKLAALREEINNIREAVRIASNKIEQLQ